MISKTFTFDVRTASGHAEEVVQKSLVDLGQSLQALGINAEVGLLSIDVSGDAVNMYNDVWVQTKSAFDFSFHTPMGAEELDVDEVLVSLVQFLRKLGQKASYTPENMTFYLSRFCGCCAEIPVSWIHCGSENPGCYSQW